MGRCLKKSIVGHYRQPDFIFVPVKAGIFLIRRQFMKLIGVKEVSEFLSVKPSTVYQWSELGQDTLFKINGASDSTLKIFNDG